MPLRKSRADRGAASSRADEGQRHIHIHDARPAPRSRGQLPPEERQFFNENFTPHSLERLSHHGALLRAFTLVVRTEKNHEARFDR
jgi:hypothetical protein